MKKTFSAPQSFEFRESSR